VRGWQLGAVACLQGSTWLAGSGCIVHTAFVGTQKSLRGSVRRCVRGAHSSTLQRHPVLMSAYHTHHHIPPSVVGNSGKQSVQQCGASSRFQPESTTQILSATEQLTVVADWGSLNYDQGNHVEEFSGIPSLGPAGPALVSASPVQHTGWRESSMWPSLRPVMAVVRSAHGSCAISAAAPRLLTTCSLLTILVAQCRARAPLAPVCNGSGSTPSSPPLASPSGRRNGGHSRLVKGMSFGSHHDDECGTFGHPALMSRWCEFVRNLIRLMSWLYGL
jgi:hypothetical protein